MDCGLSKTSSVTSMSFRPKASPISLPMVVLRSWKEGRQCMKTAWGPALAIRAEFTW